MYLLAVNWPFLNFLLLCVCVALLAAIWVTVRHRNGKTKAFVSTLLDRDQAERDEEGGMRTVGTR